MSELFSYALFEVIRDVVRLDVRVVLVQIVELGCFATQNRVLLLSLLLRASSLLNLCCLETIGIDTGKVRIHLLLQSVMWS